MDVQSRINRIKERREALTQRLTTLERQAKTAERKRDTRRKIIIGGAVLAHLDKDAAFAASIRSLLGASVGRLNDREVIADLLAPVTKPRMPAVTPHAAPATKPRAQPAQPPKAAGTPTAHVKTATAPAAKAQPQASGTQPPVRSNPLAGLDLIKPFDEDEDEDEEP
jgi:hypothetical protein